MLNLGLSIPQVASRGAGVVVPYSYNLSAGLAHWRAKRNGVRAGTNRARALHIGDSKTVGQGAGATTSPNYWVGARVLNVPNRVKEALLGRGIPANTDVFFGDAGTTPWATYDGRVVLGSGWSNAQTAFGGSMLKLTSGGAGAFEFAVATVVDRLDVYYLKGGAGSCTLALDSDPTVVGTVDGSGGGFTLAKATISFPRGIHTMKLTPSAAGDLFIVGMHAWDSAVSSVDIFVDAVGGWKVSDADTATFIWTSGSVIPFVAPDVSVINLGTNEKLTGVPLSTFKANLVSLVTKCKLSGDVLLLNPPAYSGDTQSRAMWDAVVEVAAAKNCAALDLDPLFAYAVGNTKGYYRDIVHETAAGYAAEAALVAQALAV